MTSDNYDGSWVKSPLKIVLAWSHVFGPYYLTIPTTTTAQIAGGEPFEYTGPIVWSTPGETTMTYSSLSTNNVPEALHHLTMRIALRRGDDRRLDDRRRVDEVTSGGLTASGRRGDRWTSTARPHPTPSPVTITAHARTASGTGRRIARATGKEYTTSP